MERILIEVDKETKKALKDLAYKEGKTMKMLLNEMIAVVLKKG